MFLNKVFLTEDASCKACRPLPQWWRADSGCDSDGSCLPEQLDRRRRAELHGERRRCTPPSPERCRHTWSRWGPGAAGWSGPDAWPGGRCGSRNSHGPIMTIFRHSFILAQSQQDSENHLWKKSDILRVFHWLVKFLAKEELKLWNIFNSWTFQLFKNKNRITWKEVWCWLIYFQNHTAPYILYLLNTLSKQKSSTCCSFTGDNDSKLKINN